MHALSWLHLILQGAVEPRIDTNREGVRENPTLTLWVQKLNALILSLDAEFIGFSPLFVFISACLGVAQRRRVHSWFSYFLI